MSSKKNEAQPMPTGKQIRKAMIQCDVSPLELAKAMGVSAYYIREIYAERRKAVIMRKRIAQYLGGIYKKYNWLAPKWISREEKAA